MEKNSVFNQLILWFLPIVLIPLTLLTYISYQNARDTITKDIIRNLKIISEHKASNIEEYALKIKDDVKVLANSIELFLTNNISFSNKLDIKLQNFLLKYKQTHKYYDIFLINPNGDIIFSVAKEDDLGTNLKSGKYKDSGLAKAFNDTLTLLDSKICDFEFYSPSNRYASFVAYPILQNEKIVAVVATQINNDELHNIVNDYSGLGKSGEIVVGRKKEDGLMFMAPLRHKKNATYSFVDAKIATAIPLLKASSGEMGTSETVDYRAKEILATWRYLPSFRWGMVVKIDKDEVFKEIDEHKSIVILIFLLTVIISVIAIYLISKKIATPIEILTKALKEKNRELKRYLQMVDENVITSTTDLKGLITYVSEAFCKISGYTKEELVGKAHNIVRDPEMPKEIYEDLWRTIESGREWEGEIKNIKKDGSFYWVKSKIAPLHDKNEKIGYISIREDITDKKRVEELSITDGLTGLYNRRYFNEMFTKEIARSKRDGKYLSFLILDIDHFKQYNDTYGHQAGDDVLKSVAKALKECVHRGSDFVFRLGGEEFGILFSDLNEKRSLEFANRVREAIEGLKIEHSKNSASAFVTSSFGLVVQKGEEIKSEDEIYKLADEGLYEAKESGRNRVVLSK